VASNLALKKLYELSKEIEMQAKLNTDPSKYIDELKEVIQKTMQMITELTLKQ